jgi:hypothetical protein
MHNPNFLLLHVPERVIKPIHSVWSRWKAAVLSVRKQIYWMKFNGIFFTGAESAIKFNFHWFTSLSSSHQCDRAVVEKFLVRLSISCRFLIDWVFDGKFWWFALKVSLYTQHKTYESRLSAFDVINSWIEPKVCQYTFFRSHLFDNLIRTDLTWLLCIEILARKISQ